jgi:uncharacterized protein (DUF362 family)
MKRNPRRHPCSRRSFLRAGMGAAAGVSLSGCGGTELAPASTLVPPATTMPGPGHVSIVRATSYDAVELSEVLAQSFDQLGGIGELVRGRSVAVKVNLTGYAQDLFGRPPGETYATHDATVHALARHLFSAGATRVRVLESAPFRGTLESWAGFFGWNVPALRELGVELENTRNLGFGGSYARLAVPNGRLFSFFDLNHAYADHDVVVSLAKMKNHVTAGVTLSMKNLFGITPNSLYGVEAPDENAEGYRGVLHRRAEGGVLELPGEVPGYEGHDEYFRIPNIITDINAARPIHLAIIDGITTMSGGEGPWNPSLRAMRPGVLIAGFDAVSTDAVATAVMGYPDPLTARGTVPFAFCENHLRLAHQAGLGNGDLSTIVVAGESIQRVRQSFAWL